VHLSLIHFISRTVKSPLQVKAFTPLTVLEPTTHVFWGQQWLRRGNYTEKQRITAPQIHQHLEYNLIRMPNAFLESECFTPSPQKHVNATDKQAA
jgi:Asp-tRNA(Asn)/Glu-tRNA(Gln) amidotransferase C subunit